MIKILKCRKCGEKFLQIFGELEESKMYTKERKVLEREIGKVTDEEFKLAIEMTESDLRVNRGNDFFNILATSIDIIRNRKILN